MQRIVQAVDNWQAARCHSVPRNTTAFRVSATKKPGEIGISPGLIYILRQCQALNEKIVRKSMPRSRAARTGITIRPNPEKWIGKV